MKASLAIYLSFVRNDFWVRTHA